MKLTVVIPAHNEQECIETTLRCLQRKLKLKCELVVVDDHSSDDTVRIVRELMREFKNLTLLANPKEKGFANALRAAFLTIEAGAVVPVMADSCDRVEDIELMYRRLIQGYDIICASRYLKGGRRVGSRLKGWVSRGISVVVGAFTGIPVTDITNSFKMYRKDILDDIVTVSSGFEISMELMLKAYLRGYRICEIPTVWRERSQGKSKFRLYADGRRFFRWVKFAIVSRFTSRADGLELR
jgi:glycosyltransferase involved in cell wall biosynthesis